MGADLYIEPGYRDATRQFYQDKGIPFEDQGGYIHAKRDLTSEEYEARDKATSAFYFRDSYNSSSVAWRLGLSYWAQDYEEGGTMKPENLQRFYDKAKNGTLNLRKEVRQQFISQAPVPGLEDRYTGEPLSEDDQEYFRGKRKRLVAFLELGMQPGNSIHWSV